MTNEEAIKTLSNDGCYECSFGCESPAKCTNAGCDVREAVLLAISAFSRDRWISASTPPDTNRFVLVMNDDGRCGVAQYVGDDIAPITPWQIAYCLYDVDAWDDKEQGPVCWWRELPEPPKEET